MSLSLRRAWIEIRGVPGTLIRQTSLSLRRAWIEIESVQYSNSRKGRRSPYGERGLKYLSSAHRRGTARRSPYGERGLKFACIMLFRLILSRSPYGERGLKWLKAAQAAIRRGRSPYGERGLKSDDYASLFWWTHVALLTESVD